MRTILNRNYSSYSAGFQKGHIDGFQSGKLHGFERGRSDVLDAIAFEQKVSTVLEHPISMATSVIGENKGHFICEAWERLELSSKVGTSFAASAALISDTLVCLKDTRKSSIWKLEILFSDQTYPLILKIFKMPVVHTSLIELNMYQKANTVLQPFMPQIIHIESEANENEIWVFMEYVQQLKGQIKFSPDYFAYIIPTLARLHAHTFNERWLKNNEVFMPWLPLYHSEESELERKEKMKKTIKYLDMAMARNDLRETVEDAYPLLQQYLRREDSILFPELVEAGQSIVHGDLQTLNIGCNNVSENNDWTIKFIDWEGASFAPCWFDMVNLVGVFLAYRSDWRAEEAQIVSRCVDLYASEMLAQGISFRTEPLKLYKMAYVQRIVEKSLEMQLSWRLSGRSKGNILAGSIEKLTSWGRELGLM